ncbi:amidohydrolase [soil metagenome]
MADLIVTNARIRTMDPAAPHAEAIAVTGETITAVGSNADILALRTADTRIIDAGGNSVLPGFIESHMHLFVGAAELEHLQLFGVNGRDALTTAIRDYAAARPQSSFLLAQGADYTILSKTERVTRHDLDRIIADRPFAMTAPDHHTMWANTKALELSGLLHGRTLGPGNEIVMAADGLAEGELREGEAFDPLIEVAGESRVRLGLSTGGEPATKPTPQELVADLAIMERGLKWAAKHGITSIHNMDGNLYTLELLSTLESQGKLSCRVKVPFHYKNFMKLADLEKASQMAARYKSDWLSSGFVKVFYDGVLDSFTAVMLEPYADRPGWCGDPLFSPEHFAEVAVEADRRGLQIAVHAIGDAAVRAVLDGYEKARQANGARDSRHRIEHIEVTTEADIPRFGQLGVIASMQPTHPPGAGGFPLEPTVSRIGRARWPVAYPWRSIRKTGAHVVFASDWPVSPIDPLLGLQSALTRNKWDESNPDHRFTLDEAIAGYTVEGAYTEFREDRKGALKTGYLADIVVLSGDLDETPPDALRTITPAATICGGRVTYEQ